MPNTKRIRLITALLFWTGILTIVLTPPIARAGKHSWRFIVTGDSRSNGEHNGVNVPILIEIANEILKREVDFVLISGDLVVGSRDQEELQSQLTTWMNVMRPVYNAGIGVYPIRGNHDTGGTKTSDESTAWNNIFSGRFALPNNGPENEKNLTYSFIHKNSLVIGLEQYGPDRHTINQQWLEQQLAANTKPHIFVYGHAPAFEVHHKDCLDDHPEKRNDFMSALENAGGRLYFAGHDHLYDHAAANNDYYPDNDIHQFIVGTAGAPLRNKNLDTPYLGQNTSYTLTNLHYASRFGYLIVAVKGLEITTIWMERTEAGKYKPAEVFSYTANPKMAVFTENL
jgi:hypothetical protein